MPPFRGHVAATDCRVDRRGVREQARANPQGNLRFVASRAIRGVAGSTRSLPSPSHPRSGLSTAAPARETHGTIRDHHARKRRRTPEQASPRCCIEPDALARRCARRRRCGRNGAGVRQTSCAVDAESESGGPDSRVPEGPARLSWGWPCLVEEDMAELGAVAEAAQLDAEYGSVAIASMRSCRGANA